MGGQHHVVVDFSTIGFGWGSNTKREGEAAVPPGAVTTFCLPTCTTILQTSRIPFYSTGTVNDYYY